MKRFVATTLLLFALTVALGVGFVETAEASVTHTVQKGESLFLIGQRYGVSVDAIKNANGLNSNTIHPGQRLTIPAAAGNAGINSTLNYVVQKGDTMFLIARKYGVTVDAIKAANNHWSDTIYPGQVLKIPQRSSSPTTTVSRSFSRADLNLLARAVYGEARGEPYEGQVAVAAVILNRVKHGSFPNTIPGVIYEPLAFTAVADGQINLTPNETAHKAVQDALNGWDPSGGALYYWNPAKATSKWVWSRTIIKKIGNHVFAI